MRLRRVPGGQLRLPWADPPPAHPPRRVAQPVGEPVAEPRDEPVAEPVAELEPSSWTVEVIRSARRKRSTEARLIGTTLRVRVPSWMSAKEVDEAVEKMRARFAAKRRTERFDLPRRAAALAARHGLPTPREIRWVGRLSSRWGSCRADGVVHLSSTLAAFPDWVVDYVIVHELAHLAHFDHGPQFWELVHRYPRAERAIGYLIARSGMDDPDDRDDLTLHDLDR